MSQSANGTVIFLTSEVRQAYDLERAIEHDLEGRNTYDQIVAWQRDRREAHVIKDKALRDAIEHQLNEMYVDSD